VDDGDRDTEVPGDPAIASTVDSDRRSGGTANTVAPGTVIGRYTVIDRLGAGAMGVVYRARDERLRRDIALKLVAATGLEEAQERLEREAQAMAQLADQHVVTVHDTGVWNGQVYLAMELVSGGSLGAWLGASPRGWRDVVQRFIDAGRGLAAAHAAGLVHRDFKPDNVLLTAAGVAKVGDFGLVRGDTRALPSDLTSVNRTVGLVGTPVYMPPEQLRGEPVDARADQYSFCASLWEGLHGVRPFAPMKGSPPVDSLIAAIEGGRPDPGPTPARVPGRLRTIIARGLSARPGDRWPSVAAVVGRLEAALRRRRRRVAIAIAAAAIVIAGTVITILATRDPEPVPEIPGLIGPARAHFDLGRRAAMERDYPTAMTEFQRAYEAYPAPEILFNMAQIARQLHDCPEMNRLFDLYEGRVKETSESDQRVIAGARASCK
jgi:serine/threonine protein kinase